MLHLLSESQRAILEQPQYMVKDFLSGKLHPRQFLNNFPPFEIELIRRGIPKPFTRSLIRIAEHTISPNLTAKERMNFNSRSGISKEWAEESITFIQDKIIGHLYKHQNAESSIRKAVTLSVYYYINSRMSKNESAKFTSRFNSSQLSLFDDIMTRLKASFRAQGFNAYPGSGEFYTEVSGKLAASEAKTMSQEELNLWVNYKEYFTFVPVSDDADEILSEIIRFYDAIFRSFIELENLSLGYGIRMGLKYKNNLEDLFKSFDNLVVYSPNPKVTGFIRERVKSNFSKLGVYSGSTVRAESGFDIMTPKGGFSHSKLIAMAIADVFVKDYLGKQEYSRYPKSTMEVMLRGLVKNFGTMPPDRFYELVRKNG